ncbi:inactive transglutaminase family protein [Echinimonas agarilytica]|uniref:Inactive transglutaminase family protein n=1 Tax=Echinimonas agarilytica TaxID=1215918 RepID=A0AA41W7A4_9GAMM|nr:inactive transglutaminase family protein [Echinimonas agarilytica]MCM2679753.1 inactive transglutaminase family protein [Echinimonas agarilytica]
MLTKYGFRIFIAFLFIAGLGQVIYRHVEYGIPLAPSERRDVWHIDASIQFMGNDGPVNVSFALPETQKGYNLLTENMVSPGFGVAVVGDGELRRSEWTISQANGPQTLFYKVQFAADNLLQNSHFEAPAEAPKSTWMLEEPYRTAANQIKNDAIKRSASALSLARQIGVNLANDTDQNVALLMTRDKPSVVMVNLLAEAGVNARVVNGLLLDDGRRRQSLKSYVQVYDNEEWHFLDPETGNNNKPQDLLIWGAGHDSVLEVVGASNSSVRFSMLRQEESALSSINEQLHNLGWDNFSIYSLPLDQQTMIKSILLLPIGALVVVFMKVVIGLRTSGTFMPVLIAMAFVQTSLLPGLTSFILVVGTGLLIRSYLSKINLLLVARISAVIIVVIGLIIFFTLTSYQLGITDNVGFALFPLIIMAWTIERMSILWEEEGANEVLVQGGGSLLVAMIAYVLISTPLLRHLSFNFLGLQLIVLSLILWMGQYNGYRLTELWRFKAMYQDDGK